MFFKYIYNYIKSKLRKFILGKKTNRLNSQDKRNKENRKKLTYGSNNNVIYGSVEEKKEEEKQKEEKNPNLVLLRRLPQHQTPISSTSTQIESISPLTPHYSQPSPTYTSPFSSKMKTLRTTLFAKKNKHHNDNSEGSTNRATAPPCYLDGQFYNLVNEGKSAGGLLPFFDANNNNQSRNRHMDSQVNIRSGSGHSLGDNSSNNHSQFQYQESLSRHALSKNNKNALSPNDIGGNNASSHTGGSGKPRSPFPLGNSNYANSILITKNNREKYNMFSPSLSELNFSNQYKLVSFDFDESLHSNSHHSSSPFSRGGYGSISTSNSSKSITADSSSVNPNANNEWLAYNTIFLFQNTKSLWKIVSILMAQEEHSKVMNMPTHPDKRVDDNYKIDDTTIYKETMHKKMIKCSPPEYVNFAFKQ